MLAMEITSQEIIKVPATKSWDYRFPIFESS
jgi:hypothetical protein